MKHFRIRMDDGESSGRGFYEIMRRGRIVCLRENQFIVPEPALTLLDELGVEYAVMGEDDPDAALRTVRDSVAAAR